MWYLWAMEEMAWSGSWFGHGVEPQAQRGQDPLGIAALAAAGAAAWLVLAGTMDAAQVSFGGLTAFGAFAPYAPYAPQVLAWTLGVVAATQVLRASRAGRVPRVAAHALLLGATCELFAAGCSIAAVWFASGSTAFVAPQSAARSSDLWKLAAVLTAVALGSFALGAFTARGARTALDERTPARRRARRSLALLSLGLLAVTLQESWLAVSSDAHITTSNLELVVFGAAPVAVLWCLALCALLVHGRSPRRTKVRDAGFLLATFAAAALAAASVLQVLIIALSLQATSASVLVPLERVSSSSNVGGWAIAAAALVVVAASTLTDATTVRAALRGLLGRTAADRVAVDRVA